MTTMTTANTSPSTLPLADAQTLVILTHRALCLAMQDQEIRSEAEQSLLAWRPTLEGDSQPATGQ